MKKITIKDSVAVNNLVRQAALRAGMFYEHIDGSLCCSRCEKTIKEGCKHGKVSVTICQK